MPRALTLEEAAINLFSSGFQLLGTWKNSQTPVLMRCLKCGDTRKRSYGKRDVECGKCLNRKSVVVICSVCDKLCEKRQSRGRPSSPVCSEACRVERYRLRNKSYVRTRAPAKRKGPVVRCVICGGEFRSWKKSPISTCCSLKCASNLGNNTRRPRRLALRSEKRCPMCDRGFVPSARGGVFCSRECWGISRRTDSYNSNPYKKNRVALERAAPGLTAAQRKNLLVSWKKKLTLCWACREALADTVDHLVPLSRGGSNKIENLAPACRRCNSSRGSSLTTEWTAPKDKGAAKLSRRRNNGHFKTVADLMKEAESAA